jgi:cellulose synthase/poly-beta-1,6-N-acetylglucosamine synthase-like glycosyltransferase
LRKDAWRRAGGYPEWADHNEDTVFVAALRRAGCRMVFVPEAIVSWEPSTRLRSLFKQFFRYARGDAQAHLFFGHYYKNYAISLAALLLLVCGRRPAVRWLVAGLAAASLGKQMRRAAKRTGSAAAVALTPLVVLTLDLAHLAGYVVGVLDRRWLRK